jgi:hypothetical protein
MLFFELFPAFMLIIALVAGVWLFVVNHQASRAARNESPNADPPVSSVKPQIHRPDGSD